MEYLKILLGLFEETGNQDYLSEAERQIEAYYKNVALYRGFPELYDKNGNFFRKMFKTAVRRTGWIVSFEQVLAQYVWSKTGWE